LARSIPGSPPAKAPQTGAAGGHSGDRGDLPGAWQAQPAARPAARPAFWLPAGQVFFFESPAAGAFFFQNGSKEVSLLLQSGLALGWIQKISKKKDKNEKS